MIDFSNILGSLKDLGNNFVSDIKNNILGGASGMMYPSDLMSSNYGHSYVMFYAYVNSKSQASGGGNAVTGLAKNLGSELAGQIAELGSQIGIGESFTKTMKKMSGGVALYMPNDLQINYGTEWSEATFPIVSGGLELANSGVLAGKTYSGSQMPTENDNHNGATYSGTEAGGALALGLTSALGTGVMTGMIANPKKEQQFQGVDFRQFQFQYVFAPRDKTEAKNVLEIIYFFKYHMHPEFLSKSKFIYITPSEFDIEYYYNGSINKNIHQHATSVLTGMSVNYSPNNVYSIYDTGIPTQIVLTLNFKELMVVTKETVLRGL